MKTSSNIRTLLLSLILLFTFGMLRNANAQPGISVSFQQFYDELSPYGEWVDDPDYGYIWVPDVEPDFQPYATNGRWVMTDYGNTWVSNYNWGWAPFHYGRWNYNNRFGWSWVPGYEWGPAWVNWRSGGGYYGWAPLGPGISIGVSVNIPANLWIFVPQRYLLSSSIHRYYAPRRTIVNVYNRTTIINNTYVRNNRTYVSGPRRADIQRVTRTSVPVHRITDASRPGTGRVSGRSVEIYRPNITKNAQARPSRTASASNTRTSIRPSGNNTNSTSRPSVSRPSGNNTNSTSRPSVSRPTTSSRSTNNNRATVPSQRSGTATRENSNVKSTRPSAGANTKPSQTRTNGNNRSTKPTPSNSGRVQPSVKQEKKPSPAPSRPAPQRTTRPSSNSRPTVQPKPQRSERPASSSSRTTRGNTSPSRSTRT